MKIFAFVILHYNTIDDTRECVSSIRKYIKDGTCHIIIVDNGSPNGSGKILADDYQNDKDITVIINNENLGFARGNNVGFKYAKEKLNADFIILANSDTTLTDDRFVSLILEEYERSHFAVLGPREIIPDPPYVYRQQNIGLISRFECLKSILKIGLYYFLSYVGIDLKIKKWFDKDSGFDSFDDLKRQEDIMLHGFFWIFSPVYTQRFDGLNNHSFLYREEDLLFLRLIRYRMKSVYLPTIEIKNKCGSSTSTIIKDNVKRRRFKYRQLMKSTWVLYKELGK